MAINRVSSEALIVAYYLSRFDDAAYSNLGFDNKTRAHSALGNMLATNPNTLKLRRDDFDPLHGHRVGWYQTKLSPRLAKVVETFQELSIEELNDIVLEILTDPKKFRSTVEWQSILLPIDLSSGPKRKFDFPFIARGPTGRHAEEFFVAWHKSYSLPIAGNLSDKRDFGCGYDFLIEMDGKEFFVEVKGLDGSEGGVAFTSKEWDTAREKKEKYFVVLVRNLSTVPDPLVIQNPAKVLNAKKYIYRPVQVRWTVSESELRSHSKD